MVSGRMRWAFFTILMIVYRAIQSQEIEAKVSINKWDNNINKFVKTCS